MSENNQKQTVVCSCKDCVFAVYDGITQVGCKAKMTDKFPLVKKAKDDEKEFDLIVGAACPFKRTGDFPSDEKGLEKVRAETKVPFDAFILCQEEDLEKLKTSISFIKNQAQKPRLITAFVWQTVYYKDKVLQDLFQSEFEGTGINWRFSRCLEEPNYELEFVDTYYADKTRLGYCYSVFKQGADYGPDFFTKLMEAWIFDLHKSAVCFPDEKYDAMSIKKGAHIYLGSNITKTAKEIIPKGCTTHKEMFQE